MKTLRFDISNLGPERAVREGRAKVMEMAEKMGLPPEALKELAAKVEQTAEEFLREGPKRTSARSIAGMLKEVRQNLGELVEGFVGLAKGSGEPNAFTVGMVAADVESARSLIEAAHGRLRDMMDAGAFDKKPEAPPAPSVEPKN